MKEILEISEIKKYFENYSSFLDSEYLKAENLKNQASTKRTNHLSIIISFVMILLTIFSFTLSLINSNSAQLEASNSICYEPYLSMINDTNFTKSCINMSLLKSEFNINSLKTNSDIFSSLKWFFLLIAFIFLFSIINDFIVERRQEKPLEDLNEKIVLIKSIILSLSSLEICHKDKLKNKEIQETLALFDKNFKLIDEKKKFEIFNDKLIQILNQYLKKP